MKAFLFILILILLSAPAIAVWDSSISDRFLGEGNVIFMAGYNVKVTDINVEGESVGVIITDRKNKTLYDGPLTERSVFEMPGEIMVKPYSFRYYDPIHPQVNFELSRWLEAEIIDMNFPDKMYRNDAYKTYVTIKNTALYAATYQVELSSGENLHLWNSNADISRSYIRSPKTQKTSVSQEVTLQPGKSAKLYFDIQPYKISEGEATPVITIRSGSNTIGQEVLDSISIVDGITGYIQDIIVPNTMYSGREAQVKVIYRNSWIGSSSDFFIELIAPEFRIIGKDTIRGNALSQRTEEVTFRIMPLGGGDFTLTADLSIGREQEDSLSTDVKVSGEKVYSIDSVEYPRSLKPGESGIVFVTVKNDAPATNTMTVEATGKGINVQNPKAVVKLGHDSKTRVMFNINSISEERFTKLEVKLYDRAESFVERQYARSEKLIDSKSYTIMNPDYVSPTAPKPVEEEKDQVNETVVEQEDDPVESDLGETVPDETEEEIIDEKDAFTADVWLENNWRYAAIGFLAFILIILIIITVRKKHKRSVEVYK